MNNQILTEKEIGEIYRAGWSTNLEFARAIEKKVLEKISKSSQESQICRNIYEVWAGSEGILKPLTSKEAYLLGLVEEMRDEAKKGLKPLYAPPPKREWVGLTEDEKQFFKAMGFSGIDIVEAKLKEKNT